MTLDPKKTLKASLLALMVTGVALCAFSSPARAYLTHGLLQPGLSHGDEITAKSGETWWGLYQHGDDFELRTTSLSVLDVHDPIVDLEGEMSGKRVTVDTHAQPLFLVHGLPWPLNSLLRVAEGQGVG